MKTLRFVVFGSVVLLFIPSPRPALSLPTSFRWTDDCCNQTYSGSCNARPSHPDPRCRAGHSWADFDPDFFCTTGCVGNPGQCLPDIPTGSVVDIPNGQDDDCDGVVDAQFTGPASDLTILTTDCCHFRFRDRCDGPYGGG